MRFSKRIRYVVGLDLCVVLILYTLKKRSLWPFNWFYKTAYALTKEHLTFILDNWDVKDEQYSFAYGFLENTKGNHSVNQWKRRTKTKCGVPRDKPY